MKLKPLKEKIGRLYNKVYAHKEGMVDYVRRKCDDIPPQRRFRVVATAFAIFALLALFVFGKSMYNIYHGVRSTPSFGSMTTLPVPEKGDETNLNLFDGSESIME